MILRAGIGALVLSAAICSAAMADDDTDVDGGSTGGGIFVKGTKEDNPPPPPPPDGGDSDGPRITLVAQTCVSPDNVPEEILGTSAATFCSEPEPNAPVLTVSIVRRAFAELKLPAAKLVIQPPDGLTLVNFDTNFYTTSTRAISRTVTLLGQEVTLEATPAEFRWTFGDGKSLATTEPGTPYPDLTVTHNYLQTGTYQPSLDTVFTGRFRVGGGAWQQIPGTVTIEGTGQDLRAIEAQPKLVGY